MFTTDLIIVFQWLESKDVELFIHRGPLHGRAGKGAWGWQQGPLVSDLSKDMWIPVVACHALKTVEC